MVHIQKCMKMNLLHVNICTLACSITKMIRKVESVVHKTALILATTILHNTVGLIQFSAQTDL